MISDTEFISLMSFELARLATRRAKQAVRSRAIKQNLTPQFVPELTGPRRATSRVHVPFFWARYYHDGRGAMRSKKGKFLVFYKNVEDDPRTGGAARNYPKRKSDRKRLTKSQFQRDLRAGKIVATTRVGPTGGTFFFTKGMRQFPAQVRKIVEPGFRRQLRESFKKERLFEHQSVEINLVF